MVILNTGNVQSNTTIILLFNFKEITYLNIKMDKRESRSSTGILMI
jgi:hypothetical protein